VCEYGRYIINKNHQVCYCKPVLALGAGYLRLLSAMRPASIDLGRSAGLRPLAVHPTRWNIAPMSGTDAPKSACNLCRHRKVGTRPRLAWGKHLVNADPSLFHRFAAIGPSLPVKIVSWLAWLASLLLCLSVKVPASKCVPIYFAIRLFSLPIS
jgi:hypothetical protein